MIDLPLGRGWIVGPLALIALVALGALVEAWLERRAAVASRAGGHTSHSRIDLAGSCLSAACAVHCLLMPLLVTLLPFGALTFLADESFERALIISSLVLATASFCCGYRRHRRWRALMTLAAAAVLLLAIRPQANESWESVAAALGGFGLAAGHWLNRRLCRSCPDCGGDHA